MGFDFGQVNGKRFKSNSWVEDENAWTGTSITPMSNLQPLPPVQPVQQQRGILDKLKDFGSGIGSGLRKVAEPYRNESINMFDVVLKDPNLKPADRIKYQAKKDALLQPGFEPSNTSGKIGDAVGELVGNAPAFVLGGAATGGIAKGIMSRLSPKVAPKALPWADTAVKGGLSFAAVAPMESNSLKEIPENVAKNFALGAGMGVGARGAGIALKPVGNAISKGVDDVRNIFKPLGVPNAPLRPTAPSTPVVRPTVEPQPTIDPLNRFQVRPSERVVGSEIPQATSTNTLENGMLSAGGNMSKVKITSNDDYIPMALRTTQPVEAEVFRGRSKVDSGYSGVSRFGEGTYYSNSNKVAEIFAKNRGEGASVEKSTIKLERPFVNANLDANSQEYKNLAGLLKAEGLTERHVQKILEGEDLNQFDAIAGIFAKADKVKMWAGSNKANELIRKSGYDGIIGENRNLPDLPNHIEIVRFEKPPVSEPLPQTPLLTITPQQPNIGEPKIVNERRFAGNVRESQVAPEGIKQNTIDNPLTYEPITNRETLNKANTIVETDAVKARELFDAPSKGISADDVALGESLIVKAIKDGDTGGANKLIADLAEKLTTAGQAVQAAKMFKRLTPEGMLLYAQRVVNSTNKDLLSRLGKKAPKVELTPEDSTFIIETMRRIRTLPDGDEKRVAMGQIEKLIKDKVPATLTEKILAVQRISLLLNPKTMGRNVIGNTLFGAIDNVSNVVATPIDMLTSKLMKTNRTTTLPSLTGQLKSAKEGARITARDARMGIDTYHNNTQYEFSGKKIFTGNDAFNKTLDKLDRATVGGLKLGDTPFHKAAYDDSLRQQMKLAGVTKPTPAMEEQASQTALQRTYQDVNAWTEGFKLAQKALNGGKSLGLGNIVLPFVKTPANILARAMDYSPIGLQKALREAMNIKKGKFNQKAFVDSISRSIVGTAIIAVGYDLAKQGVITGGGNKDKDVAAFERGLGKNDFAWKMGDKYYTYEWMQPASMSLAVGADMYLKGKEKKDVENVIANAIKSGGETLFKQSVMQGLQRFMGGYDPIDNIARTGINAPTQLIPTLSNQIGQITDPTQRATYDPTNLGTGKNLLKARIPGLNKTLEPKIDTFGETVKRNQGNNNLFNVFGNPGTVTNFKPSDVQKEILRLYNSTGEKDIFPRVAPKTLLYKGESIRLTPKEMTSFQQTAGKVTNARLKSIIEYNDGSRDDVKRAEEFKKAIEKAYDDARIELLKGRGIDTKSKG